jgi:anti-sigma factor RsiW
MAPPADPSDLPRSELEAEVTTLRAEVAELKQLVAALRDENARLKGLKPWPVIKPSGMEDATEPKRRGQRGKRRRRGKVVPRVPVETEVLRAEVPAGSQFKGYEPDQVQDLVIRGRVVRYRRERWLTPDGTTIVAPLPCR